MSVPAAHTLDGAFALVRRGDQAAFATVYDELADRVFGTVQRVLRDPAMSEEVAQEVFVELWRTADRFDDERGNVTAWTMTIARRRAVDRVRREQSQRNRIDDLNSQPTETTENPADAVVSSMDATRVRHAMSTLPDDQRVVLEMSFFDGVAHGDIAERLDVPLGTVKGRARGGLKKLRSRLGGMS